MPPPAQHNGRCRADDALLLAIVEGRTAADAAAQAHVSVRTLYRRLEDPAFQKRLEDLRAERRRALVDGTASAAAEALSVLRELAKDPGASSMARVQAAKTILEHDARATIEGRLAQLEQLAMERLA